MQNKIDSEALLSTVNIYDVISKYVMLEKKGSEYYGICPFHNDTSASLQVNTKKEIYSCFACGKSGDAIQFLRDQGKTFHEACEELQTGITTSTNITKTSVEKSKPKEPEWKPIIGGPKPKSVSHYQHGKPSKIWGYKNNKGEVVGYICRFDLADGRKEVLPYSYATNGTKSEWRWLGFEKPRPLYNLDKILNVKYKDASILIVEGEKTADAAQKQLDPVKTVVTCWIGGAKQVKNNDWSPLYGRNVIYFPDNDQPGIEAMREIRTLIGEKTKKNFICKLPDDLPKHWDLADREWKAGELRGFVLGCINKQAVLFEDYKEKSTEEVKPAPVVEEIKMPEPPKPKKTVPPVPPKATTNVKSNDSFEGNRYFKYLGYENNDSGTQTFHFFVIKSKTVTSLTASQMSANNLMTLAELNYWEEECPARTSFDTKMAMNMLIQKSYEVGIYSDKFIRGRGAWIDDGRIVIHNGMELIVDGTPMDLGAIKSKFIYKIGQSLDIQTENPLGDADAKKFVEMLQLINWDRAVNPMLLAGWCVIAPICGALNWRPHIWITGGAGSGKTWIFKKIIKPLLGSTGVSVQGSTTEPGLRQLLKQDALPVIFDEMDVDNKNDADRIQTILALMRSASAEDGGLLAKGTSGGTAMIYQIRSVFAFASISVQLAQQADRTRVTILSIKNIPDRDKAKKEERWKKLQEIYNELVTPEFCDRLRARTIKLLPIIIKNARTFSNAGTAVLGEQRAGDQLGAILAGVHSLYSDELVDFDGAVEWIAQGDWSEERMLDHTRDEQGLINVILEQITRVEGNFNVVERSISELISHAAGRTYEGEILTGDSCHNKLKRIGLKIVDNKYLEISNTSQWIKKTLEGTAWSKNHNKILMRIEGASMIDSSRFGSNSPTRAVRIPLDFVLGKDTTS